MNHQCCATVPDGTFRGHRCTRQAKAQKDGLWYCSVHDPEAVDARRMKRLEERGRIMNSHVEQVEKMQRAVVERDRYCAALEKISGLAWNGQRGFSYLAGFQDAIKEATSIAREVLGTPPDNRT